MEKSIFRSWTFWFNAALGAVAALIQVGTDAGIGDHVGWWVTAQTVGNLLLRLKTSVPVTLSR